MVSGKAVVVCIGSTLLCLEPAWAQDGGARALGRANAFRADPTDAAAAPGNLAALAMDQRYDVYVGAMLGPDATVDLRGGALDSRTSPLTLAAGYRRRTDDVTPTGALLPGWKDPDGEISNPTRHEGVHAGLAVPLADRRASVGLLLRYDWRESFLAGTAQAFNLGGTAAWRPHDTLIVAVAGRNLLENAYPDTRREGDLGVRWAPGEHFSVSVDAVAPLSSDFALGTMSWHGGLEGSATEWLTLRGGYANEAGAHVVGAGLGLASGKTSLDYGVRIELADASRLWHALDARIAF